GLTSYKNPKKDLEFELSKCRLSNTEYHEIKKILINNSYDFSKILFNGDLLYNDDLSDKAKKVLEIFYNFTVDYDFEQMVSKLGGKRTSYGSVEFPKDTDDDILDAGLIEISKISSKKIEKLLESLDESNFIEDFLPFHQYYMCPVYGQISAGQPNWAEENIEGKIPIDVNLMDIVNPEEHFFLRVNGESMNKIVKNGAFALIHKQDTVENGEIAVVLVNGFDATIKKFTKQGDLIVLEPQSNDESFETQVYDKNTSIKILGKYVGKMEINK
ncbi:MAG: hypothetical protein HFH67_17545, partial [Lachnospiraceae bacterium]|nr:hypothetical protein [Lachnospiraceae bacterium]